MQTRLHAKLYPWYLSHPLEAGEVGPVVRAPATLPQAQHSVPSIQPSVTPTSGNLIPFSDLCEDCAHTQIHAEKITYVQKKKKDPDVRKRWQEF